MDLEQLIALIVGGSVFVTILSILAALLCTLVPIGLLIWYVAHRARKAGVVRQASQAWLTTTGTILKSRVEVSGGSSGASVDPRVIYEYTVNDQNYQGEQIRAGDSYFHMTNSRQSYDTVDRYPVGAQVTVYYNPVNPSESALER